jgi:hypothetical protein
VQDAGMKSDIELLEQLDKELVLEVLMEQDQVSAADDFAPVRDSGDDTGGVMGRGSSLDQQQQRGGLGSHCHLSCLDLKE